MTTLLAGADPRLRPADTRVGLYIEVIKRLDALRVVRLPAEAGFHTS